MFVIADDVSTDDALPNGTLAGWIEPAGANQFVAAFIGEGAGAHHDKRMTMSRPPATRICATVQEARQWLETEAMAFGLPLRWVDDPTHR